ncbi:MAG: hypothetical protein EHM88_11670, partial [Candidatus Rokuibacteriota bacterium]
MAITATNVGDLTAEADAARRPVARVRRFVRRQPTFSLGLAVLLLIVVSGVLAPLWWTGEPQQMRPVERL